MAATPEKTPRNIDSHATANTKAEPHQNTIDRNAPAGSKNSLGEEASATVAPPLATTWSRPRTKRVLASIDFQLCTPFSAIWGRALAVLCLFFGKWSNKRNLEPLSLTRLQNANNPDNEK